MARVSGWNGLLLEVAWSIERSHVKSFCRAPLELAPRGRRSPWLLTPARLAQPLVGTSHHSRGAPTASASSPSPCPPEQGGRPSPATYSPPSGHRRARTSGVWKWKLMPSPGERRAWTLPGSVKFTGEGGAEGGPPLPLLAGLGALPQQAGLVPQTLVCTWGIHGRPETDPSWLGPGSLRGPHVPGLGAWGCRCPAGRRSS